MVIAVAAAWWWSMGRINPTLGGDKDLNYVRVALLAYAWFTTLSWGISRLRTLTTLEVNGSNTALIVALGLTGLALLVTDGMTSLDRLNTLLRHVVIGGVFFSLVGILQFVFRFDLVELVRFPGLVVNNETVSGLATRSSFARAEGTGLHSIEFGVVLAMILPLAIHFTLSATDRTTRIRFAVAAAVIAVGVPLSVSRSGLLAVAIALMLMSIAWTWRQRFIGVFTALGAILVMGVAIRGLIAAFSALILGARTDSSIIVRLERIPFIEAEIAKAPLLGAGVGTWSPVEDFILDNQYFGTLIETGYIGLAVVIALMITALATCYEVFRRARTQAERQLAAALMGSISVLPVSMATFDAFFYRILTGVAFLLIGSAGALWRLTVRDWKPELALPSSLEHQSA